MRKAILESTSFVIALNDVRTSERLPALAEPGAGLGVVKDSFACPFEANRGVLFLTRSAHDLGAALTPGEDAFEVRFDLTDSFSTLSLPASIVAEIGYPKTGALSVAFVASEAILIDCRLDDRDNEGILGTTGTIGTILPACRTPGLEPELGFALLTAVGATTDDGVVG